MVALLLQKSAADADSAAAADFIKLWVSMPTPKTCLIGLSFWM